MDEGEGMDGGGSSRSTLAGVFPLGVRNNGSRVLQKHHAPSRETHRDTHRDTRRDLPGRGDTYREAAAAQVGF